MEIYFVRHGETEWNKLKKFQGLCDSPLTEKGILQAKLLSKHLKDIKFDKIYSSNLKRAKDTAKIIIGERDINLNIIDEFAEISMGNVEGMTKIDFENRYAKEFYAFYNDCENYNPKIYNGENYFELRERIKIGLKKIINDNKNSSRILIVSHGATLKTLFHLIENKEISTLKDEEIPKNTSYSIVKYENNNFYIVDFSNISHLEE